MKFENNWLVIVLAGLVFGIMLLNSFLQAQTLTKVTNLASLNVSSVTQPSSQTPSNSATVTQSVNNLTLAQRQEVLAKIIPTGVPPVYGAELSISFDQPEAAITALSKLDGGWTDGQGNDLTGGKGIKFADLGDAEKARYLKIGSSIACELCCGARTLIAKNGEAACGCAHSAAMRGLAKYLLKNHAGEFTDTQILEEVTKIKTLSFPKQMVQRALELQAGGKPIDSVTQNLPSQVGGC